MFLDESGFLMAPLVRQSWSPKGQPPVLYQRTRSHQKVSVVAALCVAPGRDRLHLYFRLHPDANIRSDLIVDFLRHLRRQIQTPIALVWDRLLAHRSRKVQAFLEHTPDVQTFPLPPYAPELNPVEQVWSYLKMNPLANFAPYDLDTLADTARHHGRSIQRKQILLRAFLKHCPLPLRLT